MSHIRASIRNAFTTLLITCVSIPFGHPLTVAHAQSDGLVAYYPFDGGAMDVSGNNNYGVAFGATLTVDRFGRSDSAYSFDGVDDYIIVPDSDTLDLTTSATFAVCVYVDPDINYQVPGGDSGGPHLFTKGAVSGEWYASYAFYLDPSRSNFEVTTNSGFVTGAWMPGVQRGEWVHLAVVYQNGQAMFYKSGADAAGPYTLTNPMRVSDQPLLIGHRYLADNTGRFKGKLDNLRIYNRALSSDEIRQIRSVDCGAGPAAVYTFDGTVRDSSGNNNNGVALGAAPATDRFGSDGGAYSFDGVDDFVALPDSDSLVLTTGATFAMCVYVDDTIDYDTPNGPHLFSRGEGATGVPLQADYAFSLSSTQSILSVTSPTGTTTTAVFPAIPKTEWGHLVVIYQRGQASMYWNGVLSSSPVSVATSIRLSSEPLFIGRLQYGDDPGSFKGKLDNLRIYDRALASNEIGQLNAIDCGVRAYLPVVTSE